MAEVCERYGWTFAEYMDTPAHFVEVVIDKIRADKERSQKQTSWQTRHTR